MAVSSVTISRRHRFDYYKGLTFEQSWYNQMEMFLRLQAYFSVEGNWVTNEEIDQFWKSLTTAERICYRHFAFRVLKLKNGKPYWPERDDFGTAA